MKTTDDKNKADDREVIVVRSLEEIEDIRPIWEEMQRSEPYPVINADIDRYVSVIEANGDDVRPHVILMKQNGHPAVMLIARVEKHQLKLKLGYKTLVSPRLRCLTVEYGGILGQPGEEPCSLLIAELMKTLRCLEVDMIYFNHLKTDSCIYQLSRKLPGILSRGYFSEVETHWSMSVPENLEQFYQACSKRHRGNLKRFIRKLEKQYPDQVRIVTYSREDDLEDAIRAVSQISAQTYQHGLGCGFVDDTRTRTLLTSAARQSWLRMSVLFVDKEARAFQIGLRYDKRYFLSQIGFDPKWSKFNVGTLLFLKVLKEICDDPDIGFIDFGFGDAEYKSSYGNEHWNEASIYIFAPRFYPIFIKLLHTLVMGLSIGIKYIVTKLGFLAWVKRRWRNVLQKYSKR